MTVNPRGKIWFIIGLALSLTVVLAKPVRAQDASLELFPLSESFKAGENFRAEIKVDTADVSINAAEVIIYFPADKLDVISVSKDDSIFSLWPEEPSFSNLDGAISFVGGLPTPGFTGEGNLITIEFKAEREGEVMVNFGKARVLADDGMGTNILKFIKEAKYLIYQTQPLRQPKEESLETGLQQAGLAEIFSPTHPEGDEWYSNNAPRFQWDLTADIKGVNFVLDRNPETIPDATSEGLFQSKDYEKIPDGIWYFHLRLENDRGWSETAHYKIQIDTRPPRPFDITIDNAGDSSNPKPNLYFETDDDTSGISYYKLRIGDGSFFDLMLAQINPFPLPPQSPGSYKITVRAVDKAQNIVQARTSLTIEPIEPPKINVCPEKYIAGEETFYLAGQALPNVDIVILLKEAGEGKEVRQWKTLLSDGRGEWSFSTRELLKSGTYYLSALARNKRGAVSNASDSCTIEVSFNGITIGPLMLTFGSLVLFLTLILILGFLVVGYFVHKVQQTRKMLKKETGEAKDSLVKNFAILSKEVEKKIELFDLKPGFSEREKKVYEEIKQSLEAAEKSIAKEIKDIEEKL